MCLSVTDSHYLISTGVDVGVIQMSQHDSLHQSRISSNMTSPPSGCSTLLQAQVCPPWSKHQNLEDNCEYEGLMDVMIHHVQTKLPLGVSVCGLCGVCEPSKRLLLCGWWQNNSNFKCLFGRRVWTYMQKHKRAWLRMSTWVSVLTSFHRDKRNIRDYSSVTLLNWDQLHI